MQPTPTYSFLDRLCLSVDQALRALSGHAKTTGAPYPARDAHDVVLTDKERQHAAALMRINHAGEICAQALYHGQAFVSRSAALQQKMQQAAIEEGDHLAWCHARLNELGSHTSYLNLLWYTGSFCIGACAGLLGEGWSLGFLAETERQVVQHLEQHLKVLPDQDTRSTLILKAMAQDEAKHRDEAFASGARRLPALIKKGMAMTSKIMVTMAYWI